MTFDDKIKTIADACAADYTGMADYSSLEECIKAAIHELEASAGNHPSATKQIIDYIDGFYVSGNSVPVDRPWISAESWGVAKELLALGLPLEHDLIERECVYRKKLTAYGDETRAKSPLQERIGASKSTEAIKSLPQPNNS